MDPDDSEAIPAATLVLMRPGTEGPELLMMERAAGMAFAAGALVFPGGRVDPDDHRLAETIGAPDALAAARIAAIRETIEEVGIAAGFAAPPNARLVGEWRARLRAGAPFSALLAESGLALDLGALVPFARWCPALHRTRRFDTHFFLAQGAGDAPAPMIDEEEAVRGLWASAPRLLADAEAGRAQIIYPTRRNLERIAQFASIDDAFADAAAYPIRTVVPWIEERDGRKWLCIPDSIGYPVTAQPFDTVNTG